MSIWRSPVFYFGIVLVLAVVAALAAPYVVPWNNYRGELETTGGKLTGREVTIAGPIAVKLFPWPQLVAQDVTIGNPVGFAEGAFVKADTVRVRLALAGLFSGSLDVETVDIDKPVVNLQRNASGDVNWMFAPTEKVAGQGLLKRVKLDQITIANGLVSYDDLRNARSLVFTGLNATLSAQSILGPWRLGGDAKFNDVPLSVVVTTSAKEAAQPLKFTVKLLPKDVSFPMVATEGAWDGTAFKGAVRIDPQELTGQKTSAEGLLKPLALQAKVDVSAERASLLDIRIAPSDRKDSGTLIEGAAVAEFGTQTQIRLDLKAPRVNLDSLLSSAALQSARDGGLLQVANQVMTALPVKMVVDYSLEVNTLTSGGQALNDVRLAGTAQKEAIRIKQFAAELPGRSVGAFDGIVFPGADGSQLAGKFTFESSDVRAFVAWLSPQWRETVEKHWTGSRGHFVVDAGGIDWSTKRFALDNMLFKLDESPGRVSFTATTGEAAASTLMIDTEYLDVDNFVSNGWSVVRDGGLQNFASLLARDIDASSANNRLIVRATKLLLNGVTADEVALDVASRPGVLDIKLFDIGSVRGARLRGGGSLVDSGNGPEGKVDFHLTAQDPQGFMRLAGFEYGNASWTQALGATSVDATLSVVPQKNGPEFKLVARGASGPINGELVLSAHDIETGSGASLAVSGGLNSSNGAALTRLVGFETEQTAGRGDIAFEFSGSAAKGYVFSTSWALFDAVAQLAGTADISKPYLGLAAKLTVKAERGEAALRALGLPLAVDGQKPLAMSALVAAKDTGLSLLDVTGQMGGRSFSGNAVLTPDRFLSVDLNTDNLTLAEAVALGFAPWRGGLGSLEDDFADPRSTPLQGEVFIHPESFNSGTGAAVSEVITAIGFDTSRRQLNITAPGDHGLKLDVTLAIEGESRSLKGQVRWPVDLASVLKTATANVLGQGILLLEAEFSAVGRSPAAALQALEGKGHYALSNFKLPQITLDGFAKAVLAAKTPDDLSAALALLEGPPGTDVGQRIGDLTISNGDVAMSSFAVDVPGVKVAVEPKVDGVAGIINLATSVTLVDRPDLPAVVVGYAGGSGNLTVRNATSALAAKLGYDLLSKEMAELERLQKEQEALAAKEEAQRKDDEKRFAEYQATRVELREQGRIRKFLARLREVRAVEVSGLVTEALKANAGKAKAELAAHARRLAIVRGIGAAVPPL